MKFFFKKQVLFVLFAMLFMGRGYGVLYHDPVALGSSAMTLTQINGAIDVTTNRALAVVLQGNTLAWNTLLEGAVTALGTGPTDATADTLFLVQVSSGFAVVVYLSTSNQVKFLKVDLAAGTATTASVISGVDIVSGLGGLDLNSDGDGVVAYLTGGAVKSSTYNGATFESPTIISASGSTMADCAIDDAGNTYFTYDRLVSGGYAVYVCVNGHDEVLIETGILSVYWGAHGVVNIASDGPGNVVLAYTSYDAGTGLGVARAATRNASFLNDPTTMYTFNRSQIISSLAQTIDVTDLVLTLGRGVSAETAGFAHLQITGRDPAVPDSAWFKTQAASLNTRSMGTKWSSLGFSFPAELMGGHIEDYDLEANSFRRTISPFVRRESNNTRSLIAHKYNHRGRDRGWMSERILVTGANDIFSIAQLTGEQKGYTLYIYETTGGFRTPYFIYTTFPDGISTR